VAIEYERITIVLKIGRPAVRPLWVPNRSSMSCDVGIFVDQPAEQVAAAQVQG
jgi:hypothetical protein